MCCNQLQGRSFSRILLALVLPAFCLLSWLGSTAPASAGNDASSPLTTLESHVADSPPASAETAPAPTSNEEIRKLIDQLNQLIERLEKLNPEGEKPQTSAPGSRVLEGVVKINAPLRVRSWPWGKIIGTLQDSDKVEVLGVSGDFYKIRYEGGEAYIHRHFVSVPGKPANSYPIKYPSGCAEGGNGYLPRPGATTKPAPKPAPKPTTPPAKPGEKGTPVDLSKAKTIGDARGDGTRIGAVAWALDQMSGGKQNGINSNNGKRSSNISAWNGFCLAFVSTAWGRKVSDLSAGSAYLAYKQCVASGRKFQKSGTPTPGAAMFFGPTAHNSFGHAIIATGEVDRNGDPLVLSTTGWGGLSGIQKMPLSRMCSRMGSAKFLGWTSMP